MNQLQKYIEEVLNSAVNFESVNSIRDNFPKYRITQADTNTFILDVALAGYDKDCIKVKTAGNRLSVSYKNNKDIEKISEDYPKVIINQIAERDFDKVWLTDEKFTLEVNKVTFKDGILSIIVEVKVPESLKEKEYTIK